MSTKTWATYGAVFVAGALVVGGVWSVVAITGNQVSPATPAPSALSASEEADTTNAGQPADNTAAEQPVAQERPVATEQADGLTPIGSVARNQMVTIAGTVDRITDEDEFYLRDNTGSIKVWTGNSFFTVEPGETVQVSGFVDDGLFIEVYATEIVRESGDVIQISGYSSSQ
jgi:uncharacterized protein YdeI (BOF family)